MKLDFAQNILTIYGEAIKSVDGKENADLKHVCVEALMAVFPDEKDLSGAKKLQRFRLAKKISVGGEVELEVEDVSLIKELVGKAFGPNIVGPAYEMLEGKV